MVLVRGHQSHTFSLISPNYIECVKILLHTVRYSHSILHAHVKIVGILPMAEIIFLVFSV